MFLSTFEKQLDSKRRIVVPQEFRATAAVPASASGFDGVFCFPSIEAECLEGGGQALFSQYQSVIEELPLLDPLRSALEVTVPFDAAGRIVLPEGLCEEMGITDWVALVGLGDRFQIWSLDAFKAHRETQRQAAREGLASLRTAQRLAKAGTAA